MPNGKKLLDLKQLRLRRQLEKVELGVFFSSTRTASRIGELRILDCPLLLRQVILHSSMQTV